MGLNDYRKHVIDVADVSGVLAAPDYSERDEGIVDARVEALARGFAVARATK